ncbi:hypothetical protein ACHWGP_27935, partial [Klebsiella pneumoniae]
LMMSLWDALRMNMMISYQELVRTFPISPSLLTTSSHVLPPWIESAGSMLFQVGILYSKLSNQAGQHAQRIYARRSLC